MLATIIIATIVFGLMGFVVYKGIQNHKKGKSTCGCNCAGCSGCGSSKSDHHMK